MPPTSSPPHSVHPLKPALSDRLHLFDFSESSIQIAFDCSDSDIDSDLDDLSRRPISESDRAKQHARQLQLWSDEARRRRSPALSPPPVPSPRRRPSSASLHDAPVALPEVAAPPPSIPKLTSNDIRNKLSNDRQQSNLSERARPNSRRVSRSHSAKNLRIRITPSSSSKSLLSDIESELGHSASASAPQSPKVGLVVPDPKIAAVSDKVVVVPPPGTPVPVGIRATEQKVKGLVVIEHPKKKLVGHDQRVVAPIVTLIPDSKKEAGNCKEEKKEADNDVDPGGRSRLVRRMSFAVKGKRLSSFKRFWRR